MNKQGAMTPPKVEGRIWVAVHYHEVRGGAGLTNMWLDELPGWLDRHWESGMTRLVEEIRVL